MAYSLTKKKHTFCISSMVWAGYRSDRDSVLSSNPTNRYNVICIHLELLSHLRKARHRCLFKYTPQSHIPPPQPQVSNDWYLIITLISKYYICGRVYINYGL